MKLRELHVFYNPVSLQTLSDIRDEVAETPKKLWQEQSIMEHKDHFELGTLESCESSRLQQQDIWKVSQPLDKQCCSHWSQSSEGSLPRWWLRLLLFPGKGRVGLTLLLWGCCAVAHVDFEGVLQQSFYVLFKASPLNTLASHLASRIAMLL